MGELSDGDAPAAGVTFHRLAWRELDAFARFEADEVMVRQLRRAERSRRKLLLHSLLEESAKMPESFGPLVPSDQVRELIARVDAVAPRAVDRVLGYPYVGSWAGYATRLLRTGSDGVFPLWVHLGYMHSVAAVAAIRAGIDFRIQVPLWRGVAALPSLGVARLPTSEAFSVAEVGRVDGGYLVSNRQGSVRLPEQFESDAPGWWAVRCVRTRVGPHRFTIRLDDVDPYRGLYEPVPPQRLDDVEFFRWEELIAESARLIVDHLPEFARTMPAGLDTLVPRPHVPYRNPSASTGEAFGSALVGLPSDGASLAGSLVHEYLHIVLGGILHLIRLYDDDPRERFYVAWRDDPRPLSGALQGAYAFFGVTALWRAFAGSPVPKLARRAAFEFDYWRRQTWHTVTELCDDPSLTAAGRRFVAGIAERLGEWLDEPIAAEQAELAAACALDHYAGWRVRHLRPEPTVVAELRDAWLAEYTRAPIVAEPADLPPTPVPDGSWSHARIDLIRLRLDDAASLADVWPTVPDATDADYAYATGRYDVAVSGYRAQLATYPDTPNALIGLGLSLGARGSDPAARALLHRPELVRAVHREVRDRTPDAPTVNRLATWIGQLVAG